jgi:hypothetical protein
MHQNLLEGRKRKVNQSSVLILPEFILNDFLDKRALDLKLLSINLFYRKLVMNFLGFLVAILSFVPTMAAQTDAGKAACEDSSKSELKKTQNKAIKSFKWPKYRKMRFLEDYSGKKGAETIKNRDAFDSLKRIPINENGDWYLSIGGQGRWRFENYQNHNFGVKPNNDDSYFLQRYFLHADLHLGNHFRVFTEAKAGLVNSYDLAGGPKPLSMFDEFSFHNIFADYKDGFDSNLEFRLRAGRWEMNYGKGRMIGCRNWSQLRRSFDGAKVKLATEAWWVEGFFAQWVQLARYEIFNSTEKDINVWGVYGHLSQKAGLPFNWEPYILAKDNTTGSKDEHRITIGSRFFGKIKDTNLSFDIEGGYQFDYDGTDVSAAFIALEGTYSFSKMRMKPYVTLGFDWASGDDNLSDGKIKTFEGVSPYGHYYFGYADEIGRQNIMSPWIRLGMKPKKKLTTMIEGHWFWADESADAIHSPCNCTKVVRKGLAGADSYIGFEVDLIAKYKFSHHLSGLMGYSYLFAGEYVKDTGSAHDDIQRFMLQMQFTF